MPAVTPSSPAEFPPQQPNQALSPQEVSFNEAFQLSQGPMMTAIESSYLANKQDVARAIEHASSSLIAAEGRPGAYGSAARVMEGELPAGAWTDTAREVAVNLSSAERRESSQPGMTFQEAIDLARQYAGGWKERAQSQHDEWMDNEANSLRYHAANAARGRVESIDEIMQQVEGMLHDSINQPDQDRLADEQRAMRDALFTEKQRLVAAEAAAKSDAAASIDQNELVDEARANLQTAYDETEAMSAYPMKDLNRDIAHTMHQMGFSTAQELGISRQEMARLENNGELRSRIGQALTAARRAMLEAPDKIALRKELHDSIVNLLSGQP